MAETLERVRVADILPLVDEYGNEYLSRDYSLDVNKEYVHELARSFGSKGEPDEHVTLVRDGDRFRVKAGNSRVRAMKEIGTELCTAVIDEDSTVQSAIEYVVRTNLKKKYEPAEESRFTQQLAMFGDDEYVGAVAGFGAERAASVRRGAAAAGERASQMSLDQLEAVAEFEGFPDLQEKVISAEGSSWKLDMDRLRREKRDIQQSAEFEREAAKLKVRLVEERPDDLKWVKTCRVPGRLEADYMEASATCQGIVGRIGSSWDGAFVDLYGEPLDSALSEEERARAERKRRAEEYAAAFKSIDADMVAWVRKNLGSHAAKHETVLKKMPNLAARAEKAFCEEFWVKQALRALPEAKGWGIGCLCFAVGYDRAMVGAMYLGSSMAQKGPLNSSDAKRLKEWIAWVVLHIEDGWEPDHDQRAFIEKAKLALARKPEGGAR